MARGIAPLLLLQSDFWALGGVCELGSYILTPVTNTVISRKTSKPSAALLILTEAVYFSFSKHLFSCLLCV